jgi:hypothetical protein
MVRGDREGRAQAGTGRPRAGRGLIAGDFLDHVRSANKLRDPMIMVQAVMAPGQSGRNGRPGAMRRRERLSERHCAWRELDNSKKRGCAAGGGDAGRRGRRVHVAGRAARPERVAGLAVGGPGGGVTLAFGECFDFLGLGGVVDEGGEEPREALRRRDDARAEERLVP